MSDLLQTPMNSVQESLQAGDVRHCMAALGIGVAEISRGLAVSGCNDLAKRFFLQSNHLTVSNGRLCCRDADQQQKIQNSVDSAYEHQILSVTNLTEHSTDDLTLVFQPQTMDAHVRSEPHSCLLLIKLSPAMQLRLARETLGKNFGITRAENEILLMMMRGISTQDMATSRRTSSETVRSQIKNLYAKTGSKGQLGLVAFASRVTAGSTSGIGV